MSASMPAAFPRRLALSLAFLFLPCAGALAHAHLQTSTPADGGTVAPPAEIRLQFSEAVEPRFSKVTLTDPQGAAIPLRAPKAEGAALVVPIGKPLSPGAYTVRWHAVSVDTHHTQGTFSFTVK